MAYRDFLKSTWDVATRNQSLLVLGQTRDEAEREFRFQTGIRREPVTIEFVRGPQQEGDAEGYCAA